MIAAEKGLEEVSASEPSSILFSVVLWALARFKKSISVLQKLRHYRAIRHILNIHYINIR
jgi:hypothetical protein